MKKISVILLFFCIPLISFGMTYKNCSRDQYDLYYSNLSTSGFTGSSDFSIGGTIDETQYKTWSCVEYTTDRELIPFVSADRTELFVISKYSDLYFSFIWDKDDNLIDDQYNSGRFVYTSTEIPDDGTYFIQYAYQSDYTAYAVIPFYVIDGKFYLELDDYSVATSVSSTETSVGSLNIGLGIIIVLLSLFTLTFIYSSMTNKKPWQK